MAGAQRSDGVLRLIAVFKLAKATLLAIAAAGLVSLRDPGNAGWFESWLARLAASVNPQAFERILFQFEALSARRLLVLSLVGGGYAVLFAVEGIGLWRRQGWAEYLTIIATGSFIPFEVWELARTFSALRVTTLVLNVLVVAYLIYRVREHRHTSVAASPPRAGASG